MGKHFQGASTMGSILGDPSFVATTNDIEKSTSAWHIPKRARNIYHSHMADRSCLKEGFGTFLSQIDGSTKLVDTAKRHYHVDETEEHQWRSSVHAVPEVDRHRHQTGKRPHDGSHPLQGQEYADLPRGRKNAPPQPNSIGDEMEVFQTRIGIVRDQAGYPIRSVHCPPNESTSFSDHNQKNHIRQGDRNNIPQTTLGDKAYSAVELAPEFRFFEKHKLGLEPPGNAFQRDASFEKKDKQQRLQKDISDVMNLPKYPKDSGLPPVKPAGGRVTPDVAAPPPKRK